MSRDASTGFPSVGPLERRVLDLLWKRSPATVAEVRAALNREEAEPYAYTTILTILVRLTDKGLVSRVRAGRADRYAPVLDREAYLAEASAILMQEFARDYGPAAVTHFADAALRLPPAQRRRLRARLLELFGNDA